MLIGTYSHNVDAKGRVFMPVKLRDELGDCFIATQGVGKCLFVFSMEEWEKLAQKFKDVPISSVPIQSIMRKFFANACECEPDKQGRILLPQRLREYIGVDKEAVVTGVMSRAEIWSKEGWDEFNEKTDSDYEQMLTELAPLGI